MLEKDLERKFCKRLKQEGGWPLKLTSPGTAGVPDRLILFPGGKAYFAELKRPGEKPRPLQEYIFDLLRERGFKVFIIDSIEAIEDCVKDILKERRKKSCQKSSSQDHTRNMP